MGFLPIRSARIPKIGVRIMPGSEKKLIRRPILAVEIPSVSAILGNAGVMLDTPRTAIRVIPNTMCRLGSRSKGGENESDDPASAGICSRFKFTLETTRGIPSMNF